MINLSSCSFPSKRNICEYLRAFFLFMCKGHASIFKFNHYFILCARFNMYRFTIVSVFCLLLSNFVSIPRRYGKNIMKCYYTATAITIHHLKKVFLAYSNRGKKISLFIVPYLVVQLKNELSLICS